MVLYEGTTADEDGASVDVAPEGGIDVPEVCLYAEYVFDDKAGFDSDRVVDVIVEFVDEVIDEDQFAAVVDEGSGLFAVRIELLLRRRSSEYVADGTDPGFYDFEAETSPVRLTFVESTEG